MTFYLQSGVDERGDQRMMLDDHVHEGWTVVEVVEADSWIEARAKVEW